MGKALLWIAIGIGIIIYNHTSETSMLVLRGTKLDFGYIAIALGVFFGIVALFRSGEAGNESENTNAVNPNLTNNNVEQPSSDGKFHCVSCNREIEDVSLGCPYCEKKMKNLI